MMDLSEHDYELLYQMEERLWISEFRFDRERMETILAADFFEFGRSGRIYSRVECLEAGREPINATLPLPNFAARLLTPDLAQLTYKSAVTYGLETEYANRTSLWLRHANGWKLKFHQGTACAA
jgi:hypothetical protein